MGINSREVQLTIDVHGPTSLEEALRQVWYAANRAGAGGTVAITVNGVPPVGTPPEGTHTPPNTEKPHPGVASSLPEGSPQGNEPTNPNPDSDAPTADPTPSGSAKKGRGAKER